MNQKRSTIWNRRAMISRRQVIAQGVSVGAGLSGAALIGCASNVKSPPSAGSSAPPKDGAPSGARPSGARPGAPVVQGTIKPGGTFTDSINATSSAHDMAVINSSVWQWITEGPMIADPYTGGPTANLVEKWEVPDPTHVVMRVRQGVKSHNKPPWNGREFTAEDLVFNLERYSGATAAAEGIPRGAFVQADRFSAMDRAEAVDKYTVRITMKQPSSGFLINMSDHRTMMMPKGVVEVGFKDPMKLAGFGPYQMTEFAPGVREVYSRFDEHWRGKPNFDKWVNTVTDGRAVPLAGFISKQFSRLTSVSATELKTVEGARPDALKYESLGISWSHIRPNVTFGAFTDFRVRKAMQLATNYQEIGDGFYGGGWGYVTGLHSYFQESWSEEKVKTLPGYNPATKAKDRDDAVKMMAAAGHANGDGVAFELLTSPGWSFSPDIKENALRFQAQMQQVWRNMKINIVVAVDLATFAKAQAEKNIQCVSYMIGGQRDISSDAYANYHTKGARNAGSFSNPESDAMIEKALQTVDLNERKQIFQGDGGWLDKYFNQWMPMIMLHLPPGRSLLQPNIKNFEQTADGPWAAGREMAFRGQLGSVS